MKKLVLILFSFISLTAFGQQDSGFTDKKEAKNFIINGKKEGKWVEYWDITIDAPWLSKDTNGTEFYSLSEYKAGKLTGVIHIYHKNGKLAGVVSYINGEKNGVEKEYYESGEQKSEITNVDGVPLMIKDFYKNGKLKSEKIFSLGKSSTKNYDESGNEIKQ